MNCPKCGIVLHFDEMSVRIDNSLNHNEDPDFFLCKGCKLKRPMAWWQALLTDIETEIKFETKPEEPKPDEGLEEVSGGHEAPWSD